MIDFKALETEIAKAKYKTLRDAQNYQGIADLLNSKPLVDNPAPRPTVAKQPDLSAILAAITATDYPKVTALPDWLMNRLNDVTCQAMLIATVTAASKTALTALFSASEPDPNWTAKISGLSWAETAGMEKIQAAHVQKVLVG